MSLMLIGGAMAFNAAFGARELYDADVARNDLNQDLRSVVDMIATETRESGERLPPDFPAIELTDNTSGDRLILRRNLVEATLLSCEDLTVSATKIVVALPAGVGNCSIVADNDADGFPDNIQEYREHRLRYGEGTGPIVLPTGYIHDPITRQGEYFSFENEEVGGGTGEWYLRLSGGGLGNGYPAVNQPRIYILHEARYDLSSGTLELRRNGVAGTAFAVADGVTGFQVTLALQDSTSVSSFTANDDWSRIQSVQIQMTGERRVRDRIVSRALTASVFPRNILSY